MARLHTGDRRLTAEEYPLGDHPHTELIDGLVVPVTPPGSQHGYVVMELGYALRRFLDEHDLGVVTAKSGFCIRRDPDTVRAPDVAFLSHERARSSATRDGELIAGYPACAPDLAIEVMSPSDRAAPIQNKVGEWLAAGSLEAWLVRPSTREVQVWVNERRPRTLTAGDTLTCSVLPGFAVAVGSLFGD